MVSFILGSSVCCAVNGSCFKTNLLTFGNILKELIANNDLCYWMLQVLWLKSGEPNFMLLMKGIVFVCVLL